MNKKLQWHMFAISWEKKIKNTDGIDAKKRKIEEIPK